MAITYDMVKSVSAQLYESSLKKIPEDTKEALRGAPRPRRNDGARKILAMMLKSAHAAETSNRHVCSDAGVPVYFVKIGTAARLDGDIKQAISDGFDHLVETIEPPILKHVTNPLTNERGYKGKDMPHRQLRPDRRRRLCRDHLLAEGAGLRPLGGARDLQLSRRSTRSRNTSWTACSRPARSTARRS